MWIRTSRRQGVCMAFLGQTVVCRRSLGNISELRWLGFVTIAFPCFAGYSQLSTEELIPEQAI